MGRSGPGEVLQVFISRAHYLLSTRSPQESTARPLIPLEVCFA